MRRAAIEVAAAWLVCVAIVALMWAAGWPIGELIGL